MDIDKEARVFKLSHHEAVLLCLPPESAEAMSFDEAELLLAAAENARERVADVDVTQFPNGAKKQEMLAFQQRQQKTAEDIINQVFPHVSSTIADEVAAFLGKA